MTCDCTKHLIKELHFYKKFCIMSLVKKMKIFIYGDSNTYGWVPNLDGYSKNAVNQQYDQTDIWWYPLLQENEVIVDGLPGRAISNDNPWLDNRNASRTIEQDIEKISADVVIFQLGTNDCKSQYNLSAKEISNSMQKLAQKAKRLLHNPKIVIISPAKIIEGNKITDKYYIGAENKSTELDCCYKNMCKEYGFIFISGLNLQTGEDGEHLTKLAHKQLSQKVLLEINKIKQKSDTEEPSQILQ